MEGRRRFGPGRGGGTAGDQPGVEAWKAGAGLHQVVVEALLATISV